MKTTPSTQNQPHSRQRAFTRTDLVVTIGTAALMAGLACSTLGGMRPATESAVCANNLRQTSQAFRAWATDHNDWYPWQVRPAVGGSHNAFSAWQSYIVLSNELSSPRVFACPSDTQRRPALHFGNDENGGLGHPQFRDRAISYFFSLDTQPDPSNQFLLGDRHVGGGSPARSCRWLQVPIPYEVTRDQAIQGQIEWTNALHGPNLGNIVLNDGTVISGPSRTLRETIIDKNPVGNYNYHLMIPY